MTALFDYSIFCSVSRRMCIQLSVFNGPVHKSIKLLGGARAPVFAIRLSNNKTLYPSGEKFLCSVSWTVPGP